MSMREELDGNVEAIKVLPEAKEKENIARADYSRACRALSDARKEVATKLSQSVSNILPSLGLDGSTLHVQLSTRSGGFEDPYYGMESVGVDIAEFQLIHHNNAKGVKNGGGSVPSKLELSSGASSGEKSRVLLAIETALPGSIGSTCKSFSSSAEHAPGQQDANLPLAIIYDEIDAHVGGRAAVTMAKLLADQSRVRRSRDRGGRSERVPKKVRSEKFCQRCKTHGGPHLTHNTSDCHKYDKDGKPLGTAPGKSSDAGKPRKKFGGDKQLAYMTAMFESIQKGLKKQKKPNDSNFG